METEIRTLRDSDQWFLWQMLYEAAAMKATGEEYIDVLKKPSLNQYIIDWKRNTDIGFLAFDINTKQPYGAVWARFYGKPDSLYWLEKDIPELALGVVSEARGRGVGRNLMLCLIEEASKRFLGLSLNVRENNVNAIALYKKLGFKKVEGSDYLNRANTISYYMLLLF